MLYLDNKATPDNKATQVLVGFLRKTHLLIMEFERIPYSCILSNSMIMSVPFSKKPAELSIKNPKCGYQLQIGTHWNFENDLLAGFWENHLPLTSKSSNSLQGEHRPAAPEAFEWWAWKAVSERSGMVAEPRTVFCCVVSTPKNPISLFVCENLGYLSWKPCPKTSGFRISTLEDLLTTPKDDC